MIHLNCKNCDRPIVVLSVGTNRYIEYAVKVNINNPDGKTYNVSEDAAVFCSTGCLIEYLSKEDTLKIVNVDKDDNVKPNKVNDS